MAKKKKPSLNVKFEKFAKGITEWTGSTTAFIIVLSSVIIWLILGPFLKFSDTWQLTFNTAMTLITFLMVFIIQRAHNKDSKALHLKLNELIAADDNASNRLVDVEDLTEDELAIMHKFYQILARRAMEDDDLKRSHSLEEADHVHKLKMTSSRNRNSSRRN